MNLSPDPVSQEIVRTIQDRAFGAQPNELEPLYEAIGDARIVMLGEASHGTSEYYTWRSHISKRLIEEKGFTFIAVEGDWPHCYEVNRFIKRYERKSAHAKHVLRVFDRWPTWMWANWEVVALAEWLREWNAGKHLAQRVGFYGLDVYSLWESLDAAFQHIAQAHPEALESAKNAFACFEPFNRDAQEYAWSLRMTPTDCEDEVLEVLMRLRHAPVNYPEDPESHFNAEQNAMVAVGAERYYRTMVRGDGDSWNVRDNHMIDTLQRLLEYHGPDSKAIVWEHNTHIGDARATDMAEAGLVNVGQLGRDRWASEGVFLVGFSSHRGSVMAGSSWGAPMERMPLPEAREDSWEDLLHAAGAENKLLISERLRDDEASHISRGHRAVGVVYHPQRERHGNYVPTVLPERYDALIYIDQTHALHPLDVEEHAAHEPPETFPWGY